MFERFTFFVVDRSKVWTFSLPIHSGSELLLTWTPHWACPGKVLSLPLSLRIARRLTEMPVALNFRNGQRSFKLRHAMCRECRRPDLSPEYMCADPNFRQKKNGFNSYNKSVRGCYKRNRPLVQAGTGLLEPLEPRSGSLEHWLCQPLCAGGQSQR